MNPFQNMEKHKEEFTQNDTKIYEAIKEKPERVISLSTSDFAGQINVSQPALTRFIKMLGYKKYNDFRSDITAWAATMNYESSSDSLPYFEKLHLLITEAEKLLTDDYMNELAKYMLSFKRIFATGISKSYQPAYLLRSLLRKHDILVNSIPLDEAIETADYLNADDLLIVFSVSAKSEIMDKVKNTEGKIMLVTTNAGHAYREDIDRMILLPFLPPDPETSSISPILFDVLVELIDTYIAKLLAKKE